MPDPAAASSNDPLATLMAQAEDCRQRRRAHQWRRGMQILLLHQWRSMGNVSASSGNKIPPLPMMNQAPPIYYSSAEAGDQITRSQER